MTKFFKVILLSPLLIANFLTAENCSERLNHYLTLPKAKKVEVISIEKRPKLLLNLDVNQTILFSDLSSGKDPSSVICHALAYNLYDTWDETIVIPISYTHYVFEHLYPGGRHRKDLKKDRTIALSNFVSYLEENDYSYAPLARNVHNLCLSKLHSSPTDVLPSFFTLISALEKNSFEFSIALRSFGYQLAPVIEEVENHTTIRFDQYVKSHEGIWHVEETPLTLLESYTLASDNHVSVQEDWPWWNAHKEAGPFGKNFLIYPENSDSVEFYFDDHVRDPKGDTNIVHATSVSNSKDYDLGSLIENGQVVRVDPIEALLDTNYFIRKIVSHLTQ